MPADKIAGTAQKRFAAGGLLDYTTMTVASKVLAFLRISMGFVFLCAFFDKTFGWHPPPRSA